MGSKGSTTQQTNSQTQSLGTPYLNNALNTASTAAQTPFQNYTGELTAGFNPQQNLGVSNINNAAGFAQPYIGQAANYINQGAQNPLSNVNQYLSPYTQNVVDATQNQFNASNQVQQSQLLGNAASAGALGGDRSAVAQAELAKQQNLAQNPVIAGLYSQGFNNALGAAQQQQQALFNAGYGTGNLGVSGQSAGLQGATAQFGAGSAQQQTQQAQDTAAYNQFLRQAGYPFQTSQFLTQATGSLAPALGNQTAGTSVTTPPPPSILGQIAGLGLVGAGIASGNPSLALGGAKGATGGGGKGSSNPTTGFTGNTGTLFGDSAPGATLSYAGGVPYPVFSRGGAVPGFADGGPIFGGQLSPPDAERMANQAAFDYKRSIPHADVIRGLMALDREGRARAALAGGYSRAAGGAVDVLSHVLPMARAIRDHWQRGGMVAGFADGGAMRSESTEHEIARRLADRAARPMSMVGRLVWPEEGAFRDAARAPFERRMDAAGQYAHGGIAGFADGGTARGPQATTFSVPIIRDAAHLNRLINSAEGDDDLRAIHQRALSQGLATSAIPALRGFADGGSPSFDEDFAPFAAPPDATPENRALALGLADKFLPEGSIALNSGAPLPRPRPFEAPGPETAGLGADDAALPPDSAPTAGLGLPSVSAQPPSDYAQTLKDAIASMDAPRPQAGFAGSAGNPLLAAGLGILASGSPYPGVAIGQGGAKGLTALEKQNEVERSEADALARQASLKGNLAVHGLTAEQAAQRLVQAAKEHANTLAEATRYHSGVLERENNKYVGNNDEGFPVYVDSRTGKETVGATKLQGKAPSGYVRNPDGTMAPIKGGPADPEQAAAVAKAKSTGGVLPDDTADWLAERVIAGDAKALTNLGRGAQGAENIIKVQTLASKKAAERGLNPNDILAKVAEQSGLTAQQRTFGTQVARMAVNSTEAQGAIDLGRKASADVPRTNWVPVNKAIQAYQSGTSDPKLAAFGAANLAIINTYSRAISPTGTPTVHDKEHAERLLSTASGPDAYNAVLDQMNKEIEIAHAAPSKAKKEMEAIRKGEAREPTGAPAPKAVSSADKQAMDWANANPSDPRAAEIKKRLGVQ